MANYLKSRAVLLRAGCAAGTSDILLEAGGRACINRFVILPVIVHMGDTRYDFPHPARLRRVLELFPKLQVFAAHFGGYSMYETAYEVFYDRECVFDVSSSLMFMEDGIWKKFINLYGAERMAFGTDYPLWDPVKETERFLQLKLTEEQFEQIGHKTAERFLGL